MRANKFQIRLPKGIPILRKVDKRKCMCASKRRKNLCIRPSKDKIIVFILCGHKQY